MRLNYFCPHLSPCTTRCLQLQEAYCGYAEAQRHPLQQHRPSQYWCWLWRAGSRKLRVKLGKKKESITEKALCLSWSRSTAWPPLVQHLWSCYFFCFKYSSPGVCIGHLLTVLRSLMKLRGSLERHVYWPLSLKILCLHFLTCSAMFFHGCCGYLTSHLDLSLSLSPP